AGSLNKCCRRCEIVHSDAVAHVEILSGRRCRARREAHGSLSAGERSSRMADHHRSVFGISYISFGINVSPIAHGESVVSGSTHVEPHVFTSYLHGHRIDAINGSLPHAIEIPFVQETVRHRT